jgi:hypothetical protein
LRQSFARVALTHHVDHLLFNQAALACVFVGAVAHYESFDCHVYFPFCLLALLFRALTARLWPRAPRFAFVPDVARRDEGKSVKEKEIAGVTRHIAFQPRDQGFWTADNFERPNPASIFPLLRQESG